MKQFAIIGVDQFGRRIIEEIQPLGYEILLIDKSKEIIDFYKDQVTSAYIANAIDEETIKKLIPPTIDGAIVDLGNQVEASILVTNYLKKMKVKNVIVKAETDQHGEILTIVGADKVVFPNKEAAKRMIPTLVSSLLFNYFPISSGLVMAETKVPPHYVGRTIVEANIRKEWEVNVIALKAEEEGDYSFFSPSHILQERDILLIVGKERNVTAFAGADLPTVRRGSWTALFKNLFQSKGP